MEELDILYFLFTGHLYVKNGNNEIITVSIIRKEFPPWYSFKKNSKLSPPCTNNIIMNIYTFEPLVRIWVML